MKMMTTLTAKRHVVIANKQKRLVAMGIVGIGNANLLSIVESCDWLAATTRTTTNASTTSSSNYYDDSRGVIICYNVSFGFSGLLLTPSDDSI
jgi:hypothetical protein